MTFSRECIISPVSESFELRKVDGISELPFELEQAVAAHWERRAEGLFNGQVLVYGGLHGDTLIAKESDYRQVYALLQEPGLCAKLGVMPLGVMGVTFHKGKVLVAKRSENVTQYPGEWEFAPSGGIDRSYGLDFRKQLLAELEEESGISSKFVEKITPFSVVHDLTAPCVDICLRIELAEEAEFPNSSPTGEYQQLCWVSPSQLSDFSLIPPCEELYRAKEIRGGEL